VIEGRFRIRTGALERMLAPGEVVETAPGVEHRHRSDEPGRIRIQVRPAQRWEEWLERVAALDGEGAARSRRVAAARRGRAAAARLRRRGHGTVPPLPVQQAAARGILRLAQSRR
jgi:hypothetical protein